MIEMKTRFQRDDRRRSPAGEEQAHVITPWRFALATLALVAGTSVAHAQFVRFFDENGSPHYVQGFDRVPERYRDSAVLLGYRDAPVSDPAPAVTSRRRRGARRSSATRPDNRSWSTCGSTDRPRHSS